MQLSGAGGGGGGGGGASGDRDPEWASRLLLHYPQLASAALHAQRSSLFSETELGRVMAPIAELDLLKCSPPRYCVLSPEELDLEVRVSSAAVRSLWEAPSDDEEDMDDFVPRPGTSTPIKTCRQDSRWEAEPALTRSLALAAASVCSSETVPLYRCSSEASSTVRSASPPSSASPAPCFLATAAAAAAAASVGSARADSPPGRRLRAAPSDAAHFDRLLRIIVDEEKWRVADAALLHQPVLLAADDLDWFRHMHPERYDEMLNLNCLACDVLDFEQQLDEDTKTCNQSAQESWVDKTSAETERESAARSALEPKRSAPIVFTSTTVPESSGVLHVPAQPSRPASSPDSRSASEHTAATAILRFPEPSALPLTPAATPSASPSPSPMPSPAASPSPTPSPTPSPSPAPTPEPDACPGPDAPAGGAGRGGGGGGRADSRPCRRLYRDVLASSARTPPPKPPPPPPPPPPALVPLLSLAVAKPVLEQDLPAPANSSCALAKPPSPTRAARPAHRAASCHKAAPGRRAASAHKAPPPPPPPPPPPAPKERMHAA
ncbi:hypothetical protein R5R35_001389 [Gryllus longicercus]|uniref:Uncharacterized protein n=1 Tax=Gryllus longicercus TaxID=2509291 RepID=A0AAN9VT10_9ORTH